MIIISHNIVHNMICRPHFDSFSLGIANSKIIEINFVGWKGSVVELLSLLLFLSSTFFITKVTIFHISVEMTSCSYRDLTLDLQPLTSVMVLSRPCCF